MKIALVGPGILPIPSDGYGAVEKHIWNLSRSLRALGHDVETLNETIGEYRWAFRALRLVESAEADVIHAHTSFLAGILATSLPLVYTSHCPMWMMESKGPREHWGMVWEGLAVRRSRHVIALTHRSAHAIAHHRQNKPISVVPNGVDPERFRPRFSERNGTRVCMLGKVVRRKRVATVAKAMRGMQGAELWVIGSQPDQEYAREVGRIREVKFIADADELEIAAILGTMDVFVHASEAEAQSMAVLEAMACGLPVVASLACEETVAGVGLVVRSDQPEEWAVTIKHVLDDDAERMMLARRSRQAAETLYSWSRIAALTERAYGAALADLPS